jgi:nucleotide-binding universal stress UspA family protein
MSQAAPSALAGTDGPVPDDTAALVIVVGYSARPEGRAALHRAIDEAKIRHAELVIVPTLAEDDTTEMLAELEAEGIPHRLAGNPGSLDPAEDLIEVAEAYGADFIVIGLRKRSPVGKRLLGSNAQRVLLDASCPVLAVKAVL